MGEIERSKKPFRLFNSNNIFLWQCECLKIVFNQVPSIKNSVDFKPCFMIKQIGMMTVVLGLVIPSQ